jgi:anaphase-promoting complex subunit 3
MGTGSKPSIQSKVGGFIGLTPGQKLWYLMLALYFQTLPRFDPSHPYKSTDSADEPFPGGDATHSQSPQSIAQSPRSHISPAQSNWMPCTASHEMAAQEAHKVEVADQHIYDLMRLFASATRALGMYSTALCMEELDKLPYVHQGSSYLWPW